MTRWPALLAAALGAAQAQPPPLSNLVIGGGMVSCTSNGPESQCTRSWDEILRADPALQGLQLAQLLRERTRAAPVVRYRLDAHRLAALKALPDALLPAALREPLLQRLRAAPGIEAERELEREALEALAWPEGLPAPMPRAALLHALALPAAAEPPRLVQARSTAFLANAATRGIYRDFVDAARQLAGGSRPRIGIVTAASRHPFNDHDIYVHALASAGAEPVWLPLDGALRRALDGGLCAQLPALYNGYANTAAGGPALWHPERQFPELAARQRAACDNPAQELDARLRGLHGIFFSGGDQSRLLEAFLSRDVEGRYTRASEQLQILRERHAAGRLVVAGSSAGNSAQSGGRWQGRTVPMIAGGDSPRVLARGFRQGSGPVPEAGAREGLGYAEGGLGFFSLGPLDSHFSERGREARLLRFVADSGLPYGFGVDENTALLVRRQGRATQLQVSGAGGVFIVDARRARRSDGTAYTLRGARVHYLHAGDEAHIDARGRLQVRLAGPLLPRQAGATPPQAEGVEQRLGFVRLSRQMGRDGAASAQGVLQGDTGPAFALRLQREAATAFVRNGGERVSYRDLRVDIEPLTR